MLDLHNAIAMASTSLLLRVSKRYMVDPPERLVGQVIALFAIIFVALEPYPQQHAIAQKNQYRIDNKIWSQWTNYHRVKVVFLHACMDQLN